MRFACLVTGYPTNYTAEHYGDYSHLFKELLFQPGDLWDSFDAQSMELPQSPSQYDVFVITGSAADAHADLPWIRALNDCIGLAFQEGVKILGFCFGHQTVANALGGRSGRNPSGWEAGLHTMELLPPFFQQSYCLGIERLRLLEIHQDHVIEPPPQSTVLASTPGTPVQIFAVGEQVLCMQGHPEFRSDMVRDLVVGRGERGILTPDFVLESLGTLDQEPDRNVVVELLEGFLGRPGETEPGV